MAYVEYTCYEELKAIGRGVIPAVHGDALMTGRVAIMGNSVSSLPFEPRTRYVVLFCDEDCRIDLREADESEAKNVWDNNAGVSRRIFPGKEYIFRVEADWVLSVIQLEA